MDPSMIMEHIDAIGLIPLLIWQSLRMEKKLDTQAAQMEQQRKDDDQRTVEMVKGWEKQLVALVNKYEAREDEIRARYDNVIEPIIMSGTVCFGTWTANLTTRFVSFKRDKHAWKKKETIRASVERNQ